MNKKWVQSVHGVWLPANQDTLNKVNVDDSANTKREANGLKHAEKEYTLDANTHTESTGQLKAIKISIKFPSRCQTEKIN
jgi:hypothetical protein